MANEYPTNPVGQRSGAIRSINDPINTPKGTFATISLESVEEMLRDTAPEADRRPVPASDIPPPLHGNGIAAPRTGAPVPPPPTAAKAASEPKRFRYASLIRDDGTLDIQGVYRIGRVPELPV